MSKFWTYWILWMLAMLAILFVASYGTPQTHYIGQTTVTPEQYAEVASDGNTMSPKYNTLSIVDGGFIFKYDFYSKKDYGFLNKNVKSLADVQFIHNLKLEFSGGSLWLVVVFIILFGVFYYYASNKRGKMQKFITAMNHRAERKRDKKIPVTENANIIAKPSDIKLNGNQGIVAVRSWKVDDKGVLTSIIQNTKWNGNEIKADKNPDKDGVKGIYGYRLGANIKQSSTVMGIVELNGKYEYHGEGIVRAEHCKVIGLFLSKGLERTARFLSNRYNVPVYLDENSEVAYLSWLYSEEGQKALQHNYELLKDG